MEVVNNEQEQKQAPKTHEDYLRKFSSRLNDILAEDGGYPLPAILTVLESAIFEMRFSLYMQQMEAVERQQRNQPKIEIPNMRIPSNKK